eukprot:g703.t1
MSDSGNINASSSNPKSPLQQRRVLPPRRQENSISEPSGHTNPSMDSPIPSTSGGSENNNPVNWGAPSSHIDTAKRALAQLEALVDDAVFLDDDTFNGMKTLSYYNQKLQSYRRRIMEMNEQLLAAQTQLARKDEQIKQERELRQKVELKVEELNSQLEDNAMVFEMHYNELLRRNEEIERLTAVIDGLASSRS